MHVVFVLIAFAQLTWIVCGLWAVWRVRRRPPSSRLTLPPVSVLKPLCGMDSQLEHNLRTFFEQDHPDYELVFGVQGEDDPATEVVRRLRARHPTVPCRLVVHDGGRGVNPKVSNLRAMMLSAVRHDVVVISDSNVAVHSAYLREMAAAMCEPDVGLVTSLFSGVGEETAGATLENLHLNGEIAAGIALPTVAGHPVVVGKSMMFRRSVFERLGGLGSVRNVLAEDYVMGRMFHHAGYQVRLPPPSTTSTRTPPSAPLFDATSGGA